MEKIVVMPGSCVTRTKLTDTHKQRGFNLTEESALFSFKLDRELTFFFIIHLENVFNAIEFICENLMRISQTSFFLCQECCPRPIFSRLLFWGFCISKEKFSCNILASSTMAVVVLFFMIESITEDRP